MFAKFTKSSKKDKYLITIGLHQLKERFKFTEWHLKQNDEFILNVEGAKLVFRVNRHPHNGGGFTAVTKAFPLHLDLPAVGSACHFWVSDFKIVK